MKLMNVSINVENDLTSEEFAENVIKNSDVVKRNLITMKNDIHNLYGNDLSDYEYEDLKEQFEEFIKNNLIELWNHFSEPLTEMIGDAIRSLVFEEFDLSDNYTDLESLNDGSFDIMVYDKFELVGKDWFDKVLNDKIYEMLNDGALSSAINDSILEELDDLIFEYRYYDKFRFAEVEFSDDDFASSLKLNTTVNIKRYK